jgi:hypothetical protein
MFKESFAHDSSTAILGPSLTGNHELGGEKKAQMRGYGPCVVVSASGDVLVASLCGGRTGWMRTIFGFVFFEARKLEEKH